MTARTIPLPKLVQSLKQGYSSDALVSDLIAGLTVGLVALPLAMAFAIASGLPPQNGIYCAIIAGFTISALGGSRVQIGGPTGAFVVVVSGIVAVHGVDGLFMCTLMAGAILVLLGITGLGTAVKFIPRPVVIGFTNGMRHPPGKSVRRQALGILACRCVDVTFPSEAMDRVGARDLRAHLEAGSPVHRCTGSGNDSLLVKFVELAGENHGSHSALLEGHTERESGCARRAAG
jgi:hypothetical protein